MLDRLDGKLAVVTGGGSGIGREFVVQLAAAGCSVATCDLREEAAAETAEIAGAGAPKGTRVSAHPCDVTDRESVTRFRDEAMARHGATRVNLVINNAGIAGAGSFLTDDPGSWERVFDVCWGGVYRCSRAFLPLLVASGDGACLVNMSSVNAFWVTHGAGAPATAYGPAKAAVRAFSEALIEDLRINAPQVGVAVVMPGSIGTGIGGNSATIIGEGDPLDGFRDLLTQDYGLSLDGVSDEEIRRMAVVQDDVYTEFASTSAAEAARTILDGVLAGHWRILVGADARQLDEAVRADPAAIYEPEFPGLREPPWLAPALLLRLGFDPRADPDLNVAIELHGGGERVAIELAAGQLNVSRGRAGADPDVTLGVEPAIFRKLLLGEDSLRQAEARRALVVDGDRAKVERFLATVVPPPERSAQ
jgi:NAD(P)-dependent dehydrogenase (short-subunit alcohol dehydrogenase family)